jgi:antibiotic biosynthesis monooxygenase (ABM) superfamily enzyme
MYGTIMIGRLRVTPEEAIRASDAWQRDHDSPGYRLTDILTADDGHTIVVAVQFDTKDQYLALAESPEQVEWWNTVMRPLLEEEPTWVDGTWHSRPR